MLVLAQQKAQEDYDKAIVSLSGGGLGVSIMFIKEIVAKNTPKLMEAALASWVFWAISIVAVVVSYYLSYVAMETAIDQFDANETPSQPGGIAARFTILLNFVSGGCFVLGIVFFVFFVKNNVGI